MRPRLSLEDWQNMEWPETDAIDLISSERVQRAVREVQATVLMYVDSDDRAIAQIAATKAGRPDDEGFKELVAMLIPRFRPNHE